MVAQYYILAQQVQVRRGNKLNFSLMNMAINAETRGVRCKLTHEDEHPVNRTYRERLGKTPKQADIALKQMRNKLDLKFIELAAQKANEMRKRPKQAPELPPTYRTPAGHTTRPAGDVKIREEAAAYELRVQRRKQRKQKAGKQQLDVDMPEAGEQPLPDSDNESAIMAMDSDQEDEETTGQEGNQGQGDDMVTS